MHQCAGSYQIALDAVVTRFDVELQGVATVQRLLDQAYLGAKIQPACLGQRARAARILQLSGVKDQFTIDPQLQLVALHLFGVHRREYRVELRLPSLRRSAVQRFVRFRRR